MISLIGKALMIVLVSSMAQASDNYQGKITNADTLTKTRLMVYFLNEGSIDPGAGLEDILKLTDDDYVQVSLVETKGQTGALMIIWAGENPHGALFVPGTSLRIGTYSDGTLYLMGPEGEEVVSDEDITYLD